MKVRFPVCVVVMRNNIICNGRNIVSCTQPLMHLVRQLMRTITTISNAKQDRSMLASDWLMGNLNNIRKWLWTFDHNENNLTILKARKNLGRKWPLEMINIFWRSSLSSESNSPYLPPCIFHTWWSTKQQGKNQIYPGENYSCNKNVSALLFSLGNTNALAFYVKP